MARKLYDNPDFGDTNSMGRRTREAAERVRGRYPEADRLIAQYENADNWDDQSEARSAIERLAWLFGLGKK